MTTKSKSSKAPAAKPKPISATSEAPSATPESTPIQALPGHVAFRTARERIALGQARRKQVKRMHHASWTAKDRKRDHEAE